VSFADASFDCNADHPVERERTHHAEGRHAAAGDQDHGDLSGKAKADQRQQAGGTREVDAEQKRSQLHRLCHSLGLGERGFG
jgi:hypothetical protein